MLKKIVFPSFVISEQQFKMCSWQVFVCSWYNFSCAALSFLGGSTWTVLLLWHLWQAGQSKEITAIKCLENFNFHTNYPHIVCHSFSGFFILCNWQKYKSKCLKRDIKFSLRMSVYLIFICKHSMLICKKKTHLSLFSALPVYWWCLQMVSCPSDMNNKLGITVSVGPIDLNDISAL